MRERPRAAMIFAAGFGTRMRPLTDTLPKPMIPLQGRPMIDHAVDLLRAAGIQRIVCNVHYLPEAIRPHAETLGLTVVEEFPDILDTGGGLRAALPALGDGPILTINPDAAWTGRNPVEELLSSWQTEMQALLLVQPLSTAMGRNGDGDFSLVDGQLSRKGPYVYTGAQIIRPDRLREIKHARFSLNRYWDLLAGTSPLHGIVHDGGWCDIGHIDGLALAERRLADG